jgi:hypothetical protein
MAKQKLPEKLHAWVEARKRFHLSHAHVQMARELRMNPRKLGGMANHRQEPWKVPLPQYIEQLYLKRFKKQRPDSIRSIEQIVAGRDCKQTQRRERQQQETARSETATPLSASPDPEQATDDRIPF